MAKKYTAEERAEAVKLAHEIGNRAAALRLLDCLAAVSGRTDAQLVVCVMRETENDPEALPRLRAGLQNMVKL